MDGQNIALTRTCTRWKKSKWRLCMAYLQCTVIGPARLWAIWMRRMNSIMGRGSLGTSWSIQPLKEYWHVVICWEPWMQFTQIKENLPFFNIPKHYVRPSFTVSRFSRRIFPGPATTQKVYQGIEWFSQLAGLQWLTGLSMLTRGITMTLTGDWHSGRMAALSTCTSVMLHNSLLTEGKIQHISVLGNVLTHQNYVSALKHNCNVMYKDTFRCLI